MAYILGISRLYVGQYLAGAGTLALVVGLAIVFWKTSSGFISGLLTPTEQLDIHCPELGSAGKDPFGLSSMFSWVCFTTAGIAALYWFIKPSQESIAVCLVATIAGLGLMYQSSRCRRSTSRVLSVPEPE
jgi:uncharacterized protein YjeT (DUF2065 family)